MFYIQNISIYMNFAGDGGMYMAHRIFFVYYSKKRKKCNSITYTKIKFYIIFILKCFSYDE